MTTIAVTLCTFRRPEVAKTLQSLFAQKLPPDVRLRIIVADNDDRPSGRSAVQAAAEGALWPVVYRHAPARNISIARNAGLEAAGEADWVAFLDDDECADPDWLMRLLRRSQATGADAVFGPAIALYAPDAPGWMRAGDYHSNHPAENAGRVITGHTCNALLRWKGTIWRDLRFELGRGKTGGEDTAYFLAVHRLGAQFAIDRTAIVREQVVPQRLSFGWIAKRKYRSGQSFAASVNTRGARLRLGGVAAGKAAYCAGAALLTLPWQGQRNFWVLRGLLHLGVIAGCLNLSQQVHYGGPQPSDRVG